MGSYNYTISIGHLGEQLTLNQWVLGSSPRWCTKVQPYGKRRAVFLLQFPGMRRTGAPSGTRTGRVGRFAYRPTTKPQWGFVSPRESPRWCTKVQPYGKLQGVFLLPLKKAGASAHFSGNTRYRYDGGQCPPPTDKPEAAFWRGVSAGWGTPPYVLKGSLWGMSDIYRAKNGQRASGMSIKFQKFRDSSAKNSK